MLQVACRPTCVDRCAGAAAAVGSGLTLLDFFQPKSATDGAKELPVLMDSSSGGGASGDADVVATGVVNRGEGGAGAGSDADVVVTIEVHHIFADFSSNWELRPLLKPYLEKSNNATE